MRDVFNDLKHKAAEVLDQHGLMGETVKIKARVMSAEKAIGNPEADDFAIQKGKERLMQAD
jgi:hypothetical protein